MTTCCPTCGQRLPPGPVPISGLPDLPMITVQERRVVTALVASYPKPVTREAMVDAIWGDDPDGGPDEAHNRLRVVLHHVRSKLATAGWRVPDARTGAGGIGLYRLEPLP